MTKERNGKMLKVGLIVMFAGAATYSLIAWASSLDNQVEVNTGDIKETKTVVRMMREEQTKGFAHLEKVIKEGRE